VNWADLIPLKVKRGINLIYRTPIFDPNQLNQTLQFVEQTGQTTFHWEKDKNSGFGMYIFASKPHQKKELSPPHGMRKFHFEKRQRLHWPPDHL
jgi:hypothetical protein